MIVNSGRVLLARLATAWTPTGDPYIELGTSNIAPDLTDNDLYAGFERKICTISYWNNLLIIDVEFGGVEGNPTPPAQIMEAGIFWHNATAALGTGTLLARFLVIPPRAKVAGNIFRIHWTGTYGQGDCSDGISTAGTGKIDIGQIDIDNIDNP